MQDVVSSMLIIAKLETVSEFLYNSRPQPQLIAETQWFNKLFSCHTWGEGMNTGDMTVFSGYEVYWTPKQCRIMISFFFQNSSNTYVTINPILVEINIQ